MLDQQVEWFDLQDDEDVRYLADLPKYISDSAQLKVVLLFGHGEKKGDGFHHLIPPSGITDFRTSVQSITEAAQSICEGREDRELLLVIDLCQAGAAIDRLSIQQLSHVWIAAASSPDRAAEDGRFTRAFTAVLNDIRERRIGTDGGSSYLSMSTFRNALAAKLNEFGMEPGHYGQEPLLVGKFSNALDPPSMIFPNPSYDPAVAQRRREQVKIESGLHEYLDDGLDAPHFDSRVGRCFAGRRWIIDLLGKWLRTPVHQSNLQIVTGSGGSGKSAVMGALVLAHHPQLRAVSEYADTGNRLRLLYPGALDRLPERAPFAAVHARQLRINEITTSIARQLAAQGHLTLSPSEASPGRLAAAIAAMPIPPTIVFDAFDESIEPQLITDSLLHTLLRPPGRPSRGPICRIIIASRKENSSQRQILNRLRATATGPATLDLDDVHRDELRSDITEFLRLALAVPDRTAVNRASEQIAEALVPFEDAGLSAPKPEFGEFLTAALYVKHLERMTPEVGFTRAMQCIPRTLPELLELSLSEEPNSARASELRSILAALAHARGAGMPASIAGMLACKVFGGTDSLSVWDLLARGTGLKAFVRTNIDMESGETLYRLFHQSLADHMLTHPRVAPMMETHR
nr:hypothetical protein GCM10025732_07120 [Glycomyces mayteni]